MPGVPSIARFFSAPILAFALVASAFGGASGCASPPKAPPAPAASTPVELSMITFSQRWIEDDYDRALAEAKRTHKAIFVDAWATFCHTCLHMRENVLDDPRLAAAGNDVIWLSIEVDRPANVRFVEAHAAAALPTFFVLDEAGNERARWVGSMDVEQVERFVKGGKAPEPGLAAITELYLAQKTDACVAAGLALPATAPETYGRLGILSTALACASDRLGDARRCQTTDDQPIVCAEAITLRRRVLASVNTLRKGPRAAQLEHADDLSSAYEVLTDTDEAEPRGPKNAAAWSEMLDAQAKEAPSKEKRAALDPHRLLAYVALGTPERAIPMLELSQREFPQDYNPPARLANVYLKLRRFAEAENANAAALGLVYGPRTLRVYAQRADIFHAAGKTEDERATLDQALLWAKDRWLPEGGRKTHAALVARRAALR